MVYNFQNIYQLVHLENRVFSEFDIFAIAYIVRAADKITRELGLRPLIVSLKIPIFFLARLSLKFD